MENASKALLIAGGILILIILVSLVLIVKNNVTNFYASEDELQMIADKTKFNEQFTRFNRDDVEGYELISLANKVVDYNERLSSAVTSNDSQAEPVRLAITLWDSNIPAITKNKVKSKLCMYDEFILFNSNNVTYKLVEDASNSSIALTRSNYGATGVALKQKLKAVEDIKTANPKIAVLTKKISNIILLNSTLNGSLTFNRSEWSYSSSTPLSDALKEKDRQAMLGAISSYRVAIGSQDAFKFTNTADETNFDKVKEKYCEMLNLNKNANNMLMYYEYTQFTKAKFKCIKMDYSDTTGKVINLEFRFTGEIE